MVQALVDLLGDRRADHWLIGPGCETFWPRLEKLLPVFAAHRDGCRSSVPAVLITQPDPLRYLIVCLAAWASGCGVVLGNPGWGEAERQQVHTLFRPDWASAMAPGVDAYRCTVPGGQWGQILIPTGGSSGRIKFAVHTWDTLMVSVEGFCAHFGVSQVSAYCVLPMFHVSGLMQALRSLTSGGQLALQPYGDLKRGDRLPLPPGGFLSLVPTQLHDLLTLSPDYIPWLQSFRAVLLGGAPAWPALLDQAQVLSLPLAPTYGMTETASQVATLLPEAFLAGHRSSGQALPHATLIVLNPQGQPQPPGAPGQVAVRATSLARGYVCAAAAPGEHSPKLQTAAQLLTDDIGYLDGDGHLHLVGRRSSTLISGGENVFPEEVEAALRAIAPVGDACVVGLPCDRWGQRLCALVVLDRPIPLATLAAALRSHLAPAKQPKQWILLGHLPRTPQGKLHRPAALALAQQILDTS